MEKTILSMFLHPLTNLLLCLKILKRVVVLGSKSFLKRAAVKYKIGMDSLVYKPSHSIFEFINLKVLIGVLYLDVFSNFRSYVKKYFSDSRLTRLMEFPVLFLGATPQNTPALYSLMNYSAFSQGTYYPMGGFHEII